MLKDERGTFANAIILPFSRLPPFIIRVQRFGGKAKWKATSLWDHSIYNESLTKISWIVVEKLKRDDTSALTFL